MSLIYKNEITVFIDLLRTGLWESIAQISSTGHIDWGGVYSLSQEQAVVGVVAAGIEHADGVKAPKEIVLSMVGDALRLEKRNASMNTFISAFVDKLQEEDLHPVLVKGQGVAQCYKRPLWRACGDVDLLLDRSDYDKANLLLQKISDGAGEESLRRTDRLHSEYYIKNWIVELHGSLHASLSNRMDEVIDEIQDEVFSEKAVRYWQNGKTQIALPSPDNDVIFVFTHILQHLFLEGVGLRQVCDLTRLLWVFRDVINRGMLYDRLSIMGVVSEWKAFGCLMVDYLGLPEDAMPYYNKAYKKKAERLLSYIIESGNFGHNRDYSHLTIKHPFKRKILIAWFHLRECFKLAQIFPIDAPRFFCRFMIDGIKAAV